MIDVNTPIRFTGGKYNGWQGMVVKLCDTVCSVLVVQDHKQFEVVEELCHIKSLAEWQAERSVTERNLKGDPV